MLIDQGLRPWKAHRVTIGFGVAIHAGLHARSGNCRHHGPRTAADGFSSPLNSNASFRGHSQSGILMAGLAEVSRIGDTLLNPFIGAEVEIDSSSRLTFPHDRR